MLGSKADHRYSVLPQGLGRVVADSRAPAGAGGRGRKEGRYDHKYDSNTNSPRRHPEERGAGRIYPFGSMDPPLSHRSGRVELRR